MTILRSFGGVLLALLALAGIGSAQKWQALNHQPSFPVGAVALLTDGTVLLHEEQDSTPQKWYKLTPDNTGSYINGTIKEIASLPVINGLQYGPFYFGSAVLTGGRYIMEGGEYNNGQAVWTNLGAIYDPNDNKWTAVKPPAGWSMIGDAQSVILNNGTYMQASCCVGVDQAYFKHKTLSWTNITNTGKADRFDEEGWTLLPNGHVLTVDAINAPHYEIYNPHTRKWRTAGIVPVRLEDPGTQEIGPAVLMPNATVFATGANSSGAGHTAIYDTVAKKWTKGPDFQGTDNCSDAPAALEINGNVIVMASPGFGGTPSTFYEWNGKTLSKIAGPPNASSDSSFYGHFLELPTGQLLFSDFSQDVEIFTPKGTYNQAWQPTITSVPSTITHGQSYEATGTQFNGLSQGAAYGDDFQDATNFALVRITNNATAHVFYAKTFNPSTMAVATGSKLVGTHFTVPDSIETGASTLEVVTNGIPSAAVSVTVN
jgi:hypothetical protein